MNLGTQIVGGVLLGCMLVLLVMIIQFRRHRKGLGRSVETITAPKRPEDWIYPEEFSRLDRQRQEFQDLGDHYED